ncbi:pyrroline-5-carboxylate reductase dimerization domain-containing protein, partial [Lactobacillus intestinalis]
PLAPAQLRDQVCSPGGTTIKGVVDLEKNGFRYSIISAINKANEN